MAAYLVRRFGLMLLTLFGISVIIFLMLRVAPGNIADVLFDAAGFVDPAQKASLERDLGLDQPLVVQYASWIDALARGDLGHSYVTDRSAAAETAWIIRTLRPFPPALAPQVLASEVHFEV